MYADDSKHYDIPSKPDSTTRSSLEITRKRAERQMNDKSWLMSGLSSPRHSESLAELSELDSAEECSLSSAGGASLAGPAEPRPSKSFIRSSSARIFAASTSSSMLFRFRPPVPVPLPLPGRLV